MDNEPRQAGGRAGYLSYLLRLWKADEAEAGWRTSLHDPRTGERLGFASLDEMFRFLQGQMGVLPGCGEGHLGGTGGGAGGGDRGPSPRKARKEEGDNEA